MRNLKKIAALVLAMSMVFSSAGLTTLAADETTVAGDEVITGTEGTGGENDTTGQTNGEGDTSEQNSGQGTEAADGSGTVNQDEGTQNTAAPEAQALETSVPEVTEEQKAFEYVYVDEQIINIPEEQNIAIVFADTELVLESATLHGSVVESGAAFDIPAVNIAENAVLFTQGYTDAAQAGQYQIDSITYRIAGQTEDVNVNFSEQEVTAGYTVTTEPETEETVSGESETPEVTVYSMDEAGNTVEQSGETENIESTVESVLETADEQGVAEAAAVSPKAKARTAGQTTRSKNKVIVICAGHDATHTGTSGNGLREEQLTWKVAQYCKAELEKYVGVTVYLDRNSVNCAYPGQSTNYCLNQRVEDAAAKGASVFVDIHFNSVNGVSTSANGAEVYYPNNSYSTAISQDGQNLANNILEKLTALGLYNRGAKIKDATDGSTDNNGILEDYFTSINMSKYYGMTGVIVEHAFLDNAEDAAKLKDENFIKQLGVADAQGIANTYGLSKDGGWKTDANGNVTYYVNNKKVYGEKKINGSWYYFDEKTGYMVTGWHDFPAKKVYYNANGQMVKGEQKIDGKWYLFDQNTGAMVTGWYNLPTKKVYYNANGQMVKGEQKIDGKWYLFDQNTGAMVTGWYNLPAKKVYYNGNGQMVKGEQKIDGKWYLFNQNTGAMVTGWYDLPTKKVYYNASGEMVKGEQKIDGKWRYFDQNTGAMAAGWINLPNKTVYYNTKGEMLYGEQEIEGSFYYFNTRTGALEGAVTGWAEKDGKKVFYLSTGVPAKGEQKIDGKWYHFDEKTGYMTTGWYDLPTKKVYYNDAGEMVKGEQKISGKWYYFDSNTGAMATKWVNLPSKKVYYAENGQMVYGQQKINNATYYFDKKTGAMASNTWIDGYYYAKDGKRRDEVIGSFYSIEGKSATNVQQMVKFYEKNSSIAYPKDKLSKGGAESLEKFAQIFLEEANREGIRAEVAWTQTMLETGYLKFGGQVSIEQFNFAGLGATGGGAKGADFSGYGENGVRMGVRAQIQHLKAYANTKALNEECVDPRFNLVTRGCATVVEYLGQKENPNGYGWATGAEYGFNIRRLINALLEM